MNNTLVRSSFSTNIKERRDCSVALFDGARPADRAGHADPAAPGLAARAASTAVLRATRSTEMRDGRRVHLQRSLSRQRHAPAGHHDRHAGVLSTGAVRFFTANIGHHSDVGGAVPGSIAGGSRTHLRGRHAHPGRCASCAAGELDEDLLDLIAQQHARPGGALARPARCRSRPTSAARGARELDPPDGHRGGAAIDRRRASPTPRGACATASRDAGARAPRFTN